MEKILITGTGRCGTTFLIKLFSFLGYNTGYNENNFHKYIYTNCNSGMERKINEKFDVLKNPLFIENIESIVNDKNIIIKCIIIPIRDYNESAKSRENNGKGKCGGLWNANNEKEQVEYYNKLMANYIYIMTKYNLNTIFLDFNKMTTNKQYLYDKLKNIFDEKNITIDFYSEIYDKTTLTSKPK
jgi:hypothetical protein